MKEKISTEELKGQLAKEAYSKSSYKFPTEEISLPSKGLVYDKDSLLVSGKIEMKYMSAKEEDILTSKSLIQNKTVLDKLFKALIITPIKYNDLLLGDKNKIMIAARILGYGKEYKTKFKCPSCGHERILTIDLQELTEKELDIKDLLEENKNEFEFVLPTSKKKIKFKLLTQSDHQKIKLEIDSMKKITAKSGISPDATITLKHTILEIDEDPDRKKINKFINEGELLAIDSKSLRTEIKRISPDVNLSMYFVCENTMECSYEDEIDVPVGIEFFWPEA